MSNSALVSYTKLSPNCTKPRTAAIDTITIHCMAGNLTVESCGALFADSSRQASSNYGIGTDGRIALYVDEANRSWCSSSGSNDHRAVTIEVANTVAADPWPVSDAAYAALLDLVTDICQRNSIKKLLWQGDSSLIGQVAKQNMTVHRWFAAKACPGDYLYNLHPTIAAEVNARLGATTADDGNADGSTDTNSGTNSGAGTAYAKGDVVNFKGGPHYVSSTAAAASGTPAAGPAEITAVAEGAAHPYHLIHADSSSTVYGWVDAADIEGAVSDNGATLPYLVRVTATSLNIRKGPGTNYGTNGAINDKGIYTIVEESSGTGATVWGRLKSGAGWISLDYTSKI